ncbi:c-type cytochrome [Vibrio tapetis]|uniref:Cytochrome c-552 n=1 Tax=Vibrio tapetis subsp. tapetis TaxID=1671868 RepID=A0A2N8ZLR2_9VIBR|nr:cytochrome c [Vibrio tapetis]SON52838.1 Cytochrome c-552 [Vibrio tapetis subsp. tapetis]
MNKNLWVLAVSALSVFGASSVLAADVAAGKAKTMTCVACHGANGVSMVDLYPNLAGQKAAYLVKQMKAFKDGDRKDPTMGAMVMPLSPQDMENIAAYYASLK